MTIEWDTMGYDQNTDILCYDQMVARNHGQNTWLSNDWLLDLIYIREKIWPPATRGGYSIAIYKCRICCVLIRMAGSAVQNLFINKIGSINNKITIYYLTTIRN